MFPIQAPILIVPTAQAQQALAAVSVRAIYDAQCLRQLKLKTRLRPTGITISFIRSFGPSEYA
jgi:hypothetical protein